MSLINDALKKVQRLHGHEHPAVLPTAHGAPAVHVSPQMHMPRRGNPPAAQLFVLIGAGAAVLIVLSVIITVLLVNRKPEPIHPAAPAPAPKLAVDLDAPSPVIVAPVITLPTSAEKSPAPAAAPASASVVRPAETSATPPLPAIPVVAVTPAPDPRIITFVDAIHVTGIRSTGDGSKVLMNDRVYRVNDVVDRLLGVKLIKVDDEMLTFSDANGVIYTKNF